VRDFTPHPYQDIMLEHGIECPRSAWWAGMGMGKTVTGLTLLDYLNEVEPGPALVLAPLRVARSTWPREAGKWSHLQRLGVVPVVGDRAAREAALRQHADVFVTNYDNVPWLVEHYGDRWPFTKVIADESTRLKNFRLRQGGTRARALGRVAHRAKHWVNLTGTPSPNGLKDLWGQTWFLDAGQRLGRTYTAFTQRWFRTGFNGYDMDPLPIAQDEIHSRLRDICVTIRPEDWFDLEAPVRKTVEVDLPPRARAHYRDMERELFTSIAGDDIEAFTAATRTAKCLQLASGFVWADAEAKRWHGVHEEKLDALESIVEEAGGEPVLVEYHWVPSREVILKRFPKARVLDANPATEDEWNAGKIPMLVANAASAGHGLNLQDGGRILARFDHWWDLEQYDQILERIGPVRQMQSGHPRTVFDYHIVARDTIDELVVARRETKREVQDLLLEAMTKRRAE